MPIVVSRINVIFVTGERKSIKLSFGIMSNIPRDLLCAGRGNITRVAFARRL